MLFLFVLGLAAFLGARCEDYCTGTPECTKSLNYAINIMRLETALQTLSDELPPNEFFQQNCDYLVEFLQCYRQGCGFRHFAVDFDVLIENVVEFCNEESNLRKAYVDNVACFNRVQITEESCVSSILQRSGNSVGGYDMRQVPMKNTDRLCLLFHLGVGCAVDVTTRTCGRTSGNAAAVILNRLMDIINCNPSEMDLFEGILGFFRDANAEQNCNNSTASCSGPQEILNMVSFHDVFPTDEDLQRHCRQFQETLMCPVERVRECDQAGNNQNLAEYEELLEVLNELCDENSRLRASYRSSVSCYNSMVDNLTSCSYDTKDHISRFMLEQQYSPLPFGTNAPLKYSCLSIDLIPDCYARTTANICGGQAAITIGKLLSRFKQLSLKMKCREPDMSIWRDEYHSYVMGENCARLPSYAYVNNSPRG